MLVLVTVSCSDEQIGQTCVNSSTSAVDEVVQNQGVLNSLDGDVIDADSFLLESEGPESMLMTRAVSPVYTWSSNVKYNFPSQ